MVFKWIAFIMAVFELGENRFQKSFSVKPTCLAVTENDFRLTNIFTFDPEMIFSPHFHFKLFPEIERERERERARARERRRPSSSQSDDRRRTPSSSPCRSRELQSDDRDLAKIEIAPARSRSRIAIVDDFFPGFVFSLFFSKHQKIFSGKFFEMQPNT